MEQEKTLFNENEKRKIRNALGIIRTHYHRCISTSRKDEETVDVQNARRVVCEASFQESEGVLSTIELLIERLGL